MKKSKGKPKVKNSTALKSSKPALYVLGIFVLLVLSIVVLSIFMESQVPAPTFGKRFDFERSIEFREAFEFWSAIITTINVVLLVYLLYNYVSIYTHLKSQFSLGLIVIASALLAHSISASPFISNLFGFRGSGLGPFTIIPSLFTLVASLVLIHLSRQ